MNDLKKLIREVPDYPKPGILFYDLTTLLKDKHGFHTLIDRLCEHYNGHTIDVVAGIEARWLHRGMTSSDVLDTSFAWLLASSRISRSRSVNSKSIIEWVSTVPDYTPTRPSRTDSERALRYHISSGRSRSC